MGRPLNNRNFGKDEGAIKVTFKVEGADHEGYIVKQLATKRYRVKSLVDGLDYDLYLSTESKDDFARIKYETDIVSAETVDGGIVQLNSKLALGEDGKYHKWTTSPFVDRKEFMIIETISMDKPLVEGKDAVSGAASKEVEGSDPVLLIGVGNPAINFALEKTDYIELGLSPRYTQNTDIPEVADPYELPFTDESGKELRFAFSVAAFKGAKLSDFSIELRIAKDTVSPDIESDYMVFKLDTEGNWRSNMDSSVITDSMRTAFVNQNIQSISFDFIKKHFNQMFEGFPFGSFQIGLYATDPEGVETKLVINLNIPE